MGSRWLRGEAFEPCLKVVQICALLHHKLWSWRPREAQGCRAIKKITSWRVDWIYAELKGLSNRIWESERKREAGHFSIGTVFLHPLHWGITASQESKSTDLESQQGPLMCWCELRVDVEWEVAVALPAYQGQVKILRHCLWASWEPQGREGDHNYQPAHTASVFTGVTVVSWGESLLSLSKVSRYG